MDCTADGLYTVALKCSGQKHVKFWQWVCECVCVCRESCQCSYWAFRVLSVCHLWKDSPVKHLQWAVVTIFNFCLRLCSQHQRNLPSSFCPLERHLQGQSARVHYHRGAGVQSSELELNNWGPCWNTSWIIVPEVEVADHTGRHGQQHDWLTTWQELLFNRDWSHDLTWYRFGP